MVADARCGRLLQVRAYPSPGTTQSAAARLFEEDDMSIRHRHARQDRRNIGRAPVRQISTAKPSPHAKPSKCEKPTKRMK